MRIPLLCEATGTLCNLIDPNHESRILHHTRGGTDQPTDIRIGSDIALPTDARLGKSKTDQNAMQKNTAKFLTHPVCC